jgi:hypothetical protein
MGFYARLLAILIGCVAVFAGWKGHSTTAVVLALCALLCWIWGSEDQADGST